jgi:hypothetical protein
VALAAYAEAWITGAKVVVFGDASSPLAERLVERGARHVQVYDIDAARAAEASAASTVKQVSYAALDLAGSALRDGVFDVGIIEDLALARRSPKDLLGPLERSLSRRGLALIGSRNPEVEARLIPSSIEAEQPLGYYDFYDLISQHFEEVRMLGQAAFVGYAIADFSASDASDVRLDTALLPSGAEEPEWFLALASALPVSPDPFSVIQLPLAELDLGSAPAAARSEVDADAVARAKQAEQKLAALEAELGKRDAERTREQDRREQERREQDRRRAARVEELEAELKKRDEWLVGLESRAATADQRADDAQSELEQRDAAYRKLRDQLTRAEHQLEEERRAKQKLADGSRALEQKLGERDRRAEAEAQRGTELSSEAKTLSARVDQLTRALAESEQRAKALADADQRARSLTERVAQLTASVAEAEARAKTAAESADQEARDELLALEGLLRERAAEVTRLTGALHETERFGRQLIVKVAELETERAAPQQSADAQQLILRNAELAADLEAARWTISSLEANVGGEPTAQTAVGGSRRDEIPPADPHPAPGAD